MAKDKGKAVRFTPKGDPIDGSSSVVGSSKVSSQSVKPILISKDPSKKKAHPKKHISQNSIAESPPNSLVTEVASLTAESECGQTEEPISAPETPPNNYFSTTKSDKIRQSQPDKPSHYDTFGRNPIPPATPKPELHSFVEAVSCPDQFKGVCGTDNSSYNNPVSFDQLIRELEIEHFGKDFEEINIDEMFSPRSESELKDLTDRLHSYVKRMREIRTGGAHLDSSSFFKSVDAMETEMLNLKNMYEREISKLKDQLADANKTKNHYELRNEKLEGVASDLQNRVAVEVDKNRRLMDDMNVVQRSLNQKEVELQNTVQQSLVTQTSGKSTVTTRQLEQSARETMDVQRRYDAEVLQRREAEEKCHSLQQTIDFNVELHRQQIQDLQDRLAAASTAILNLEGKVRVLNRPDQDQHIAEMLASVRDAAERELYKYKQDAQDNFGRNITMLKAQMDADRKSFEAVTAENRKLLGVIEELNTKVRNLQGEMIHLEHGKRSAEENVVMERDRAARHVQAMEQKLRDLQEMLFEKMKELNSARCLNLPLKAEVEGLRALLEEEEKRLAMNMKLPPISHALVRNSPLPAASQPTPRVVTPAVQAVDTLGSALPSSPTTAAPPLYSFIPAGMPVAAAPEMPCDAGFYTDAQVNCSAQNATTTARPVSASRIGPVRVKSAPSGERSTCDANGLCQKTEESNELGKGKDYFDDMFKDEEGRPKSAMKNRPASAKSARSASRAGSVMSHEYNHCTNSATGDARIHEVQPDGKHIVLVNTSETKDIDFGGFLLQQNVGGNPVAVYRFPPRVQFKAKSYITVYSGTNDPILHQPPTQFVWKEQERWGTGPECTTILCKPNGQAVAWTTAAHRFGGVQFADSQSGSASPVGMDADLPTFDKNVNAPKQEPVYLKRERESPPVLAAQKHPFGGSISQDSHPQMTEARPLELGNDNSSNQRQTRSQSERPDPVPGEPYAGAAGQRMGSAPLRRYTPLNSASGNIRKTGGVTNKPEGQCVTTTSPPSSFMTPRSKHRTGIEQIQSQHNMDFMPPMPRPPLFSTW